MSNLILLFYSIQVIHCSTNLVLTYHQKSLELTSKWWDTWKQEAQSNPMFHVNAIIINHTKHTAIKNSETMLISQFRGQKPAFYQNSQFNQIVLPALNGRGRSTHGVATSSFVWCPSDGGSSGYITQEAAVHETSAGHNGTERNTWLQDNTSIHLVTPRFTISRLTSVTLKCTLRTSTKLLIILKRECSYNKFSNLQRKASI